MAPGFSFPSDDSPSLAAELPSGTGDKGNIVKSFRSGNGQSPEHSLRAGFLFSLVVPRDRAGHGPAGT